MQYDLPPAADAGLDGEDCCGTFRATGITAYIENGGRRENAQTPAAQQSRRTMAISDQTSDQITSDDVVWIAI